MMNPDIIKNFKPDQPMPESEQIELSLRLVEINNQLSAKRTRLGEIRQRAQSPEFLMQEEHDEIRQLTQDITSLEKEQSSLQS